MDTQRYFVKRTGESSMTSSGMRTRIQRRRWVFGIICVVVILVSTQAFSNRMTTESLLRQYEEHFRLLFDHSPLGLFLFDSLGVITAANDHFVELIGSSRDVLIGLNTLMLPDNMMVEAISEALAGSYGKYEGYYQSITADKVTPIRVLFAPIIDESGRLLGGLGIIEDITDYMRFQNRTFLFFVGLGICLTFLLLLVFFLVRNLRRRKIAESKLKRSEEKYKRLAENSPAVVYQYMMDSHGRFSFTYISENVMPVTGISSEEALSDLNSILGRIHHADRDRFDKQIQRSANTLETFTSTFRYFKEDTVIWLEALSTPEKKEDGTIVWDGLFVDVTERKKAEEELRENRALFHSFVESMPQNVFSKDLQGRFTFANQRYCITVGKSLEEIVGSTDFDLHPYDLAELYRSDDRQVIESGQVIEKEEVHQPLDGDTVYVQVVKAPVFDADGQITGVIGIFWDVSKRRRAEEQLRESQEKLSALFSSMTEMVVLHELVFDEAGLPVDYRIVDCNDAFTQTTGITKEMAVGRLATEVYQSEKPPYFDEYSRVGLTGESHHFDTYYAPMDMFLSISAVSTGKDRFATVTNDITTIKRAQQTITEKNKELEQIIYVTSHDLRSPLVNVDGYGREIEYTLEELISVFDQDNLTAQQQIESIRSTLPEITADLKRIRSSAQQMDALIKGLLKLSRMGRAALNIGPVDMDDLVSKVVANMEFQAKSKDVQIHLLPLPSCQGDFVQLTQIFANLIGNAIKYLDPQRQGKIIVSGEEKQGWCEYCVEDNGIGIAPEHQEKIFELFQRLDPQRSDGEGLGLTIVKQMLIRLGGEIRLESIPGEGSRFFVKLKAALKIGSRG